MLKTVFVSSSIFCLALSFFPSNTGFWKWVLLVCSIGCVLSLSFLNLKNFGYVLDPEKIGPIKKVSLEKGDAVMDEKNKSNDTKRGRTIIGKRTRVIIGDQPPKEDDENTIVGGDTNLVVSSEEAQGKTIIGEKIEVNLGNKKKGNIDK